MSSLSLLIHDGLIRLFRKRRFLAMRRQVSENEVAEGLSFLDEATLRFLASPGQKNIFELAALLSVERSWMSRVIATLEDRKLVRSSVSNTDRRAKQVQLTEVGREVLHALNRVVDGIIQELLRDLSTEQQKTLAFLLQKLSDGIGVSSPGSFEGASEIHLQFSRLIRSLDVGGENVLGSGISITQLQILDVLSVAGEQAGQIRDIAVRVPYDQSTTSRAIATLKKRNFITSKQSVNDKRRTTLTLSASGKRQISVYRDIAEQFFENGLRFFTAREKKELLQIIEKASSEVPRQFYEPIGGGYEYIPLLRDEQRNEAESFLRQQQISPAQFSLADAHTVSVLRRNGDICALLVTSERLETGKEGRVFSIACAEELVEERELALFIRRSQNR